MNHPDDYQDEMERLSSQTADDVLSGRRSADGAARVAGAAVDRLRQALLVPPAPEVAERHLAAIRSATGSHPGIHRGNERQKRTRTRFATLGLAATLVLGAGIAAALTLPDTAAERARERTADIEAPNTEGPGNQGENGSIQSETASEHGKAVSDAARDDSAQGCDHGRAVSDLASSKADGHRQNEGDHPGSCGSSAGAASVGHSNNGSHGQGSNAGGQGSNAGGNGKNELPHGQGVEAQNDREPGSGGPPETRGASAGHAQSGK
jgi:hypothetical protein